MGNAGEPIRLEMAGVNVSAGTSGGNVMFGSGQLVVFDSRTFGGSLEALLAGGVTSSSSAGAAYGIGYSSLSFSGQGFSINLGGPMIGVGWTIGGNDGLPGFSRITIPTIDSLERARQMMMKIRSSSGSLDQVPHLQNYLERNNINPDSLR